MATAAAVSGALYNLLNFPRDYGRVVFVSSHFDIPRSSLYRLCNKFTQNFCCRPGRPHKSTEQYQIESLTQQVSDLNQQVVSLKQELQKQNRFESACIDRLKFTLICLGMPARIIADVLKDVYGLKTNHTSILQLIQLYAKQASKIMKKWFWNTARDIDVDEVYIENEPLYVGVNPESMAICKIEKYSNATTENWEQFSLGLKNLIRTTSDRGSAILGAFGNKTKHIHQSDLFHWKRLFSDELRKKEKSAYQAINEEETAYKALVKQERRGKDTRGVARKYRTAIEKTKKCVELFDHLEKGVNMVYDALKFADDKGTLNSLANARQCLDFAQEWFQFIVPNSWDNVKRALNDPHLLTFLGEFEEEVAKIKVETDTPEKRDYVLGCLCKLWENQAKQRWRGHDVKIPASIEKDLISICSNFSDVATRVFFTLDNIHRASSAVESVNSRIGLYRYNKRRFTSEFADLIALWHNLTPFKAGKRKEKSPAQILGLKLPTFDLYELIVVNQ